MSHACDTADRAGDSVLGTLLAFYDPRLITLVQARGVGTGDFFRDRQRIVWRAILALHAKGRHVDVLTVEAFLRSRKDEQGRGMLDRAGGPGYLAVAVESAYPAALKDHALLVARRGCKSRRQRAIAALALANERDADDDELAELHAAVGRDIYVVESATSLRAIDGGKAA